ncbi:MAG TPA: YafY family protein [Dongiaceae bacterium]|jgi:predicted DNA-binding transcriptional regulator YafY
MRRADRLFQIVQHLRARRLTTAAQLAEWLEVTPRTIYRDVRDLLLSGVPIDGEAGVGYRLRPGYDLPPLMFTFDEIEALVAGARIVEAWGSPELAKAGQSALIKIANALPPGRRDEMEKTRLFAPGFRFSPAVGATLETIRQAIGQHRVLDLHYVDAKGASSSRSVRPLALYFWGSVWTLGAWCEQRNDFRNFRLDRVSTILESERKFVDEPGKRLEDFIKAMEAQD